MSVLCLHLYCVSEAGDWPDFTGSQHRGMSTQDEPYPESQPYLILVLLTWALNLELMLGWAKTLGAVRMG